MRLVKYLIFPLRVVYTLYAALLFIALMIIAFPFVFAASFLGRIKGGNLIYRICIVWGDAWFFLVGIRHRNIYETPLTPHQPYIFVANHISYLDAASVVKTFRQKIRPLGKAEMGKIPVFGFIYKKAIVSVDRSSADNRARSVHILKSILRREISVLIFPEGTFNMTGQPLKEFYDGAFRIAIETKTAIRPVLFLDTYARMHYRHIFTLNPGINRSLFLEEISVEGLSIRDVNKLKEKTFIMMEQKLVEYKAGWIGKREL